MKDKPRSVGIEPAVWREMQLEKLRTGKDIYILIRESWHLYKSAHQESNLPISSAAVARGRTSRSERLLSKLAAALEREDAREEVRVVEFALRNIGDKQSA